MASVTKHGGRWRAFVRRAGTSRSRVLPTKQDAQRWAREQELELDRRAATPPDLRLTLADVVDAYTERVMRASASRSKHKTLVAIRRDIGNLRLAEITAPALLAYATRRERAGAGPPTIAMDLSYIGTVLRHGAAVLGALDAAQPALVALATARAGLSHAGRIAPPERRDRRPTDAELATLIAHFDGMARLRTPMSDITRFAVATGMRLGEIVRIAWEDFDPQRRTITIRKRKHPQRPRDQIVPLLTGPAVVCGAVVDPIAVMLRQRSALERRGRVFPYPADTVGTAWQRACRRCEIPDLHFHDLRHDAVSRMFEYGFAIEQVALVSGHTTWANLARYTQIKPESLHDLHKS